jgi:hypothetical protein
MTAAVGAEEDGCGSDTDGLLAGTNATVADESERRSHTDTQEHRRRPQQQQQQQQQQRQQHTKACW